MAAIVVAVLLAAPAVSAAQDVAALVPRIQAALEQGDLATARRLVDEAVAAAPREPAVHNLAGVVAAQQGQPADAEAHFTQAIRLAPRAIPPYENLARLYQEQSRSDPAARTRALETYARLLALEPANADAIFQSALLRAAGGEFKGAAALLARLPPDLAARPQVLALAAVVRAASGQKAAFEAAVAALQSHPDLVVADVLAVSPALAHVKDDGVEQALLAVLDVRRIATVDMRRRLGAILAAHERYDDARAVLERAADPTATVPVLIDLARVTDKTGDHTAALGYLAHARALEPGNATVHFLFGIVCVELDLGARGVRLAGQGRGTRPGQRDHQLRDGRGGDDPP